MEKEKNLFTSYTVKNEMGYVLEELIKVRKNYNDLNRIAHDEINDNADLKKLLSGSIETSLLMLDAKKGQLLSKIDDYIDNRFIDSEALISYLNTMLELSYDTVIKDDSIELSTYNLYLVLLFKRLLDLIENINNATKCIDLVKPVTYIDDLKDLGE